eukprot:TRINITY_DN14809_c0_g1_i2.p1 TRINITY_DN14809_c0_g1~~TRINITY_DN14809_c0_g1_i2.p1  ORF type:complete len:103 (+),score=36.69 TRINITY_DN14809_c0_g1_i2:96-404(+)
MVYYAVIFTSTRTDDNNGYDATADEMVRLAAAQPGFINSESFSNATGVHVTISYWKTLADVRHWKENGAHQAAQKSGKEKWYKWYSLKVCKVERDYEHNAKL